VVQYIPFCDRLTSNIDSEQPNEYVARYVGMPSQVTDDKQVHENLLDHTKAHPLIHQYIKIIVIDWNITLTFQRLESTDRTM